MAGKRVYISFAAEDAAQCNLLTAALDAWEVTYTTARPALPQGNQLPDIEKVAIRDCEVFLRLCTAATKRSESMHQDLLFFDTLQAEDRSKHQREQRALVNLILDANYQREPFDNVTLFIDTANKSRAFWLDELARPLGVATQARRLSRRSALALGVAGAVTLASGGAAATLFVRNKAASDATDTAPYGPGDVLGGQPAWTLPVSTLTHDPNTYTSLISLAVANNSLYAFAQDTILALGPLPSPLAKVPPVLWRYSGTHDLQLDIAVDSAESFENILPVFVNDKVIIAQNRDIISLNLSLDAFDVHNRTLLWSIPIVYGGPVTSVNSNLYCSARMDNSTWAVYSFDLHSGRVQWSTPIGTGTPAPGIAYAAGRLYVGDPYRCTCLRADNGKQIWQYRLPGTVVATPVIDAGVVYFGALDSFFYALDAQSGTLRWRAALNAPITAPAVVSNGVIYVGDANGYLWALSASTGATYWHVFAGFDEKLDAGTTNSAIVYQPALNRNLVAVTAGDTLTAVDLVHGIKRWPFQTQSQAQNKRGTATGPLVFDGYFVIGDTQNHVIAVNP